MKQKIIVLLERQPKWVLWSLSGGLVLLIGTIDLVVTIDLSLSIFYLVPVAIVSWFIGFRSGLVIAVFCTLAWLRADLVAKDYTLPLLPYWNAAVRFGFFAIVNYLLTALREAYHREQQFARQDGLTGLTNRRFFMEQLQHELDRARRYQYPLTLAYLDLDDFKLVNDRDGHQAGDLLLQTVAQTLQGSMRSPDLFARLGGDEFAILLPETDLDQARKAVYRLYQTLQNLRKDQGWSIGFSIGVVTFLTPPDTVEAMISRADHLMYTVKNSGKNRLEYQVYDHQSRLEAPKE